MSHSKIIDNLYLGNQYSTTIIKKVDTVISIGCQSKANNINNFKISIRDKKSSDLTPFLDSVTEYINEELNKNHKVLVHCKGGINRSTAFILAYLCKYKDMTIEEGKEWISKRRCSARFQDHYMLQIENWLNVKLNKYTGKYIDSRIILVYNDYKR